MAGTRTVTEPTAVRRRTSCRHPRRGASPRPARSAIAAKACDVELLAPRAGVDAGGAQRRLGRPAPPAQPARAARSVLRRWANAASTHGEDLLAGRRASAAARGGRGDDQPGVDVGRRPEDVAADRARPADVGVPGGLDRGHAVRPRAGAGGEPVGDLGLHHHQPALQRRGSASSKVQQHRHGDVVGQVGDQRGRRRAGQRRARQRVGARRPSSRSRSAGACAATVAGSAAASTGSTSTATTRARPRQQRQGQRAQARADLDDHVVAARPRPRGRSGARCWRR